MFADRLQGIPPRTRVKICGITRPGDAVAATELGADAIGLVFYPPSPRVVELKQAAEIANETPPFVSIVALFVEPTADAVNRVLETVAVDALQFHGKEAPAQCGGFHRPYIKAVHMREGTDPRKEAGRYPDASAILLDAYHPDLYGGTGEPFDWSLATMNIGRPLILAGGLHAGNVAEAVRAVHPYAVDVSGGVESDKGIKDREKMAAFMHEVNHGAASPTDS